MIHRNTPGEVHRIDCVLILLIAILASSLNAQQTDGPAEFHLGILVVPSKQKADAIRTNLEAGWSFGVLAKENSIDPSAVEGGYLGQLRLDELRPEFRDALKDVKQGQFSPIVT